MLSQPAPAAVSFTWTFTADPTRESDSIVPASGTGSIAKGAQLALVTVPLVTNAGYPRDELGYLAITSASGATVDPARGEVRVRRPAPRTRPRRPSGSVTSGYPSPTPGR